MTGANSEDHVRLRDDAVEWREVEGEIVAIDLQQEVYIAINKTGTVLLEPLAEGTTTEDLVSRLKEAFDVDEATAAVGAFLRSLEDQGLLERQPQG